MRKTPHAFQTAPLSGERLGTLCVGTVSILAAENPATRPFRAVSPPDEAITNVRAMGSRMVTVQVLSLASPDLPVSTIAPTWVMNARSKGRNRQRRL